MRHRRASGHALTASQTQFRFLAPPTISRPKSYDDDTPPHSTCLTREETPPKRTSAAGLDSASNADNMTKRRMVRSVGLAEMLLCAGTASGTILTLSQLPDDIVNVAAA